MGRRFLISIIFFSTRAVALNLRQLAQKPTQCVVFHTQHKAGGASIEKHLDTYPLKSSSVELGDWFPCKTCTLHCDSENWNCEAKTCQGTKREKDYTPHVSNRIARGGYVLSLAGSSAWGSPGDGRCVWATVSREPVARLVSAFLYCKHEWDKDPLCGYTRLDAKTATLQEFADHWGNFLFREFLWFPELRDLAANRPDFLNETQCEPEHHQSPWVGFKDQLNGGDDPRTRSGAENLKAVTRHLEGTGGTSPLYDVYGILERYNETMALFDDSFPLTNTSWMHGWLYESLHGNMHWGHKSESWKQEEIKTLKTAQSGKERMTVFKDRFLARLKDTQYLNSWAAEQLSLLDSARNDNVILEALSADIFLYNEVLLPMFEKEVSYLQPTLPEKIQATLNDIAATNSWKDAQGDI